MLFKKEQLAQQQLSTLRELRKDDITGGFQPGLSKVRPLGQMRPVIIFALVRPQPLL